MSLCGIDPKTDYSYEPIMIVFLILASIAFVLRCLARATLRNKVWWDDLSNTFAMVWSRYPRPSPTLFADYHCAHLGMRACICCCHFDTFVSIPDLHLDLKMGTANTINSQTLRSWD